MNQRAPATFLALGDSYTIGEAVEESMRWPVVVAERLRRGGIDVAPPRIVAKTGWTTDELWLAIDEAGIEGQTFDLVTLLIGVNNQYRGRDVEEYREQFTGLLKRAIAFARNDPSRVIVVSIPDWGATPFAAAQTNRDLENVGREIDAFNRVNREEAHRAGVKWVDVTKISRDRRELVTEDQLHPSAEQYSLWVDVILPAARDALSKR